MTRTVIITSYLEYPVDIPALLRPEDFIVCLDGGYDIAQRQGITPDLVLGDFDSISGPMPEGEFELRCYPPEKDYTDLELALRVLDPAKTPELLVIGALGGRLDMTLINIPMLQAYTAKPEDPVADGDTCKASAAFDPGEKFSVSMNAPAGCEDTGDPSYGSFRQYRRISLMDGHNLCFVVHGGPDTVEIPQQPGCYLSLLPLTEDCTGVYLDGVKYPLQDAVLHRGASLSISNEFREDKAWLRIADGSLLVIVTRGNNADKINKE